MTGQPMYGIMNGIQYSFDQSVDYLNTVESDILSKACSQLPEAAGLTLLEKVNSPLVLTLNEIQDARAHRLDSFEALTTGKLKVYELDGPLPRAYFVAGSIRAPSHMDAMRVFLHPNFHAREEVILEGPQVVERAGVRSSNIDPIALCARWRRKRPAFLCSWTAIILDGAHTWTRGRRRFCGPISLSGRWKFRQGSIRSNLFTGRNPFMPVLR